MSNKISLSVLIFAVLAAVLVSFLGAFVVVSRVYDSELKNAYIAAENASTPSNDKFSELELLDTLFTAWSYFGVDDEAVMDGLLKAYASASGDKYAEYYTAEEFAAMTAENAGEMQGIGINIIENAEYGCIEVISVMPDSPALAAGLQPGDLIVYVGIGETKESVSALGYTQAVTKLQGVAGTRAEFVVRRGEGYSEEIEFSVERGYITTQSVTYRVCATDNTVGIVKIVQFDLTTPTQFCQAVDALKATPGVDKFVFDVRYNPGGDLQSILAVLSYFLNEGDVIISTLDNTGAESILKVQTSVQKGDYAGCSVSAEDIGKYKDLKCVVLANGSTASAAELFTANFRDYNIAPIVGTTTYGKGSMQSIVALDGYGYPGGLKLTTRMYFPPCGESYEGVGIAPDVEVELDEALANVNIYKISDADDNQLQRAIQEIK